LLELISRIQFSADSSKVNAFSPAVLSDLISEEAAIVRVEANLSWFWVTFSRS
jgi:hypothetical protein